MRLLYRAWEICRACCKCETLLFSRRSSACPQSLVLVLVAQMSQEGSKWVLLTKPCMKGNGTGAASLASLHLGPMDSPGEPGHGQAATDHAGFHFFSGISLSRNHKAAAGPRGRAFMTPALPLFRSAGREVVRAGVSLPLHPCRTTVLVLMSCTGRFQ